MHLTRSVLDLRHVCVHNQHSRVYAFAVERDESGIAPNLALDHLRAPFSKGRVGWALRSWTLICGIRLVVSFSASDADLSPLWAVAIALLVLLLQVFLTNRRRLFVAPAFLALIIGTGFPLALAALVGRWAWIPSAGWGSVGRFSFTDEAMVRPFQVVVAGVVGIMVGTRLSEFLWSGLRTTVVTRVRSPATRLQLIAWVLACALVIGVCGLLGIGRTGLQDSFALPLRLNGILVFARGYLFPTLGALLVQRALTSPRQEGLMVTLTVVAVVAILASITALSRGLGAFYIVPVMFFVATYQSALGRSLRPLYWVAGAALVALALVGTVVSVQRTTMYSGDGWMSMADVAAQVNEESRPTQEVLGQFDELIGSRVGAVDGLLAVVSGPGKVPDPSFPLRIFMGDVDLSKQMMVEAFGFLPDATGGLAFGMGYSLWGLLAFGGTILIPLAGSAFLVVLTCAIEASLARRAAEGMGAVLASLFAFKSWGGPTFFEYIRVVPVFLLVLLIAHRSSRKLGKIALDVGLAGDAQSSGSLGESGARSFAPTSR